MPAGQLDANSPEYAWVASVVDRVSQLAGRESQGVDRTARWNGLVVVTGDPGEHKRYTEAALAKEARFGPNSFYATDKIVLSGDQVDTVREAIARSGQVSSDRGEAQDRWDDLMAVTGEVGAQAVRLTGPQPQDASRVAGYEGALDRGLGQVWARENLQEIWNGSDSARLVPSEGVPIQRVVIEQDSAASATGQALIALQLTGKEPWRPGFEQAGRLIETAPDQRFEAMVNSIAGSDELAAGDVRDLAAWSLRRDLGAALTKSDPEAAQNAATEAVNTVTREIDRLSPSRDREVPAETARFANDPAQAAPGPAATPHGDRTATPQTTSRQPDLREL